MFIWGFVRQMVSVIMIDVKMTCCQVFKKCYVNFNCFFLTETVLEFELDF